MAKIEAKKSYAIQRLQSLMKKFAITKYCPFFWLLFCQGAVRSWFAAVFWHLRIAKNFLSKKFVRIFRLAHIYGWKEKHKGDEADGQYRNAALG